MNEAIFAYLRHKWMETESIKLRVQILKIFKVNNAFNFFNRTRIEATYQIRF